VGVGVWVGEWGHWVARVHTSIGNLLNVGVLVRGGAIRLQGFRTSASIGNLF